MRFIGGPRLVPIRTWGNSWRATLAHAQHARGAALVVRLMIAVSAFAAAVCVAMLDHGDRPWQWLLIAGIPGIACAVLPDSHFGLVVIAAIVVPWLRYGADVSSPWSLVIAALLAVFHMSMASASMAPGAARWTPVMISRHVARTLAAVAAAAGTWLLVMAFAEYDTPGRLAVAAALFAMGVAALWTREGRVRGRP